MTEKIDWFRILLFELQNSCRQKVYPTAGKPLSYKFETEKFYQTRGKQEVSLLFPIEVKLKLKGKVQL